MGKNPFFLTLRKNVKNLFVLLILLLSLAFIFKKQLGEIISSSLYSKILPPTSAAYPPTSQSYLSSSEQTAIIGGQGELLSCSIPWLLKGAFEGEINISERYYEDSWELKYRQACVMHDMCYRHGLATYGYSQNDCDMRLVENNQQICNKIYEDPDLNDVDKLKQYDKCMVRAKMVLLGVRIGGNTPYQNWESSSHFEYDPAPYAAPLFYVGRNIKSYHSGDEKASLIKECIKNFRSKQSPHTNREKEKKDEDELKTFCELNIKSTLNNTVKTFVTQPNNVRELLHYSFIENNKICEEKNDLREFCNSQRSLDLGLGLMAVSPILSVVNTNLEKPIFKDTLTWAQRFQRDNSDRCVTSYSIENSLAHKATFQKLSEIEKTNGFYLNNKQSCNTGPEHRFRADANSHNIYALNLDNRTKLNAGAQLFDINLKLNCINDDCEQTLNFSHFHSKHNKENYVVKENTNTDKIIKEVRKNDNLQHFFHQEPLQGNFFRFDPNHETKQILLIGRGAFKKSYEGKTERDDSYTSKASFMLIDVKENVKIKDNKTKLDLDAPYIANIKAVIREENLAEKQEPLFVYEEENGLDSIMNLNVEQDIINFSTFKITEDKENKRYKFDKIEVDQDIIYGTKKFRLDSSYFKRPVIILKRNLLSKHKNGLIVFSKVHPLIFNDYDKFVAETSGVKQFITNNYALSLDNKNIDLNKLKLVFDFIVLEKNGKKLEKIMGSRCYINYNAIKKQISNISILPNSCKGRDDELILKNKEETTKEEFYNRPHLLNTLRASQLIAGKINHLDGLSIALTNYCIGNQPIIFKTSSENPKLFEAEKTEIAYCEPLELNNLIPQPLSHLQQPL